MIAVGVYLQENFPGVYSNLSDLVLGFDKKVLQMTFKVRTSPNGSLINFLNMKVRELFCKT